MNAEEKWWDECTLIFSRSFCWTIISIIFWRWLLLVHFICSFYWLFIHRFVQLNHHIQMWLLVWSTESWQRYSGFKAQQKNPMKKGKYFYVVFVLKHSKKSFPRLHTDSHGFETLPFDLSPLCLHDSIITINAQDIQQAHRSYIYFSAGACISAVR